MVLRRRREPEYLRLGSPAVFGNSVYIGVSSFGDCPLVQGQILQLNRVTGALQNQFNIVPNGCIGGGVWGSLTVDAAAGTLYFATGTPGGVGPNSLGGPVTDRAERFQPELRGLCGRCP